MQEDSYANNACLDYLDDGLAERFASSKTALDPDPSTPPKSPPTSSSASAFSPTEFAVAVAAAVSAPRRKCLITRIEAFSSSHTLENCSWWVLYG